ncbi:DUF5610 domain-containing protein [Pseudomonas borbori]
MNTLPSLTSSASRSTPVSNHPVVRNADDAQKLLANRLAERLGLEPGSLDGKSNDYTPEKVAGRILDFIEQRLETEAAGGADPAKLRNLLGQAREGVEKGFAEARKIIDSMNAYKGKVATDMDDTYTRLQDGLAALDRKFNPTAAAPATNTTGIASYSERFTAQAETFEMQVTTRDGDRLKISVAQASANWSKTGVAAASNGDSSAVVGSSQSGSMQIGGWQVDVEGELDEQERAALEKLFGQVQDLSNKFYAGDLSGAFDRAMALDMDGEQLASMSLRLTQTSVRQSTDAYSTVAEQGGQAASAVNSSLLDYAQSMLDALRNSTKLLEDGKGGLQELLKGGFSLDERFDAPRLDKAEQLNNRLLDGLQGLLGSTLAQSGEGPATS